MKAILIALLAVAGALSNSAALAQGDVTPADFGDLPWVGPGVGHIAGVASVDLGAGLYFLDSQGSSTFLEMNGNPPSTGTYTLAPEALEWFAVFTYDPAGYIRDDEQIDADALLSELQTQNRDGAAERKKLGYPVLTMAGWQVPPHYDPQSHQLEWGTRLIDDESGTPIVNYTIRMLGRGGVMAATLVTSPETITTDVASFRAALGGFSFDGGQQYGEYQQGDKLAEYGLAALVVGGAAAAAAKSGLLKPLLIGLGALVMGGLAFVRRLFKPKAKV